MKRLSLALWGAMLTLLAVPATADPRADSGLALPNQPMVIPHYPIVLPGHDRLLGQPNQPNPPHRNYHPHYRRGHEERKMHPPSYYHPPQRYKPHYRQGALYFHQPGIHQPSIGIYVNFVPSGSQRVVIGGTIYFVFGDSPSSNTWYRWHDGYHRYQVVGIPARYPESHYFTPGSVVDRLPRGASEIHRGGAKYYRYRDTYFEPMTARRGLYRVLDKMPEGPGW